LAYWGIDAKQHKPRRINREICDQADAIFLMGPEYVRILIDRHGIDLASKAYLFADPFSMPQSSANLKYHVTDPSFDERATSELAEEFSWFRARIRQIHESLLNGFEGLVPASQYLSILDNAC
jgi:protein-tyrosine-phosphatase